MCQEREKRKESPAMSMLSSNEFKCIEFQLIQIYWIAMNSNSLNFNIQWICHMHIKIEVGNQSKNTRGGNLLLSQDAIPIFGATIRFKIDFRFKTIWFIMISASIYRCAKYPQDLLQSALQDGKKNLDKYFSHLLSFKHLSMLRWNCCNCCIKSISHIA